MFQVGNGIIKWNIECLCIYLIFFGGDFVVFLNMIDFLNVWVKFVNLNENVVVFFIVVVLIGVYIMLLIWFCYMDKRDIIKVLQICYIFFIFVLYILLLLIVFIILFISIV